MSNIEKNYIPKVIEINKEYNKLFALQEQYYEQFNKVKSLYNSVPRDFRKDITEISGLDSSFWITLSNFTPKHNIIDYMTYFGLNEPSPDVLDYIMEYFDTFFGQFKLLPRLDPDKVEKIRRILSYYIIINDKKLHGEYMNPLRMLPCVFCGKPTEKQKKHEIMYYKNNIAFTNYYNKHPYTWLKDEIIPITACKFCFDEFNNEKTLYEDRYVTKKNRSIKKPDKNLIMLNLNIAFRRYYALIKIQEYSQDKDTNLPLCYAET